MSNQTIEQMAWDAEITPTTLILRRNGLTMFEAKFSEIVRAIQAVEQIRQRATGAAQRDLADIANAARGESEKDDTLNGEAGPKHYP